MPWAAAVPWVITGLSALSGALAGRKKTTTQTGTQQQQQAYSGTSATDMTTMPQYDPSTLDLKNYLQSTLMNRAQQPIDLSGYTASSMRNINQAAANRAAIMRNALTARGLQYSPVAATSQADIGSTKIGEIVNLLNSLPLMRRGLEREATTDLSSFFAQLPYGQRQTGTTTTSGTGTSTGTSTGTTTQPSDILGGLFSGLGQGVASTWGYQAQLGQLMDMLRKALAGGGTQAPPPTTTNPPSNPYETWPQ